MVFPGNWGTTKAEDMILCNTIISSMHWPRK